MFMNIYRVMSASYFFSKSTVVILRSYEIINFDKFSKPIAQIKYWSINSPNRTEVIFRRTFAFQILNYIVEIDFAI